MELAYFWVSCRVEQLVTPNAEFGDNVHGDPAILLSTDERLRYYGSGLSDFSNEKFI